MLHPVCMHVLACRRRERPRCRPAGDRFTSADQGLTRRALDALMGWRVLGLRQRERILPVGALVTVIGELAQSDAPGSGAAVGPAFKGCMTSGKGRVLVLQVGPYTSL